MPKLSWERITMEHYGFIKDWWIEHDWEVVPASTLTDEGFVIFKDETPIFAGWLLIHNSDMCFLEWIVSNPFATKEQRSGGFKYLLDTVESIAKYKGIKSVLHCTPNDKMAEMLESKGYQVTDRNCTHLLKVL